MRWDSEFGASLETLLEMKKDGMPVSALDNRPTLRQEYIWLYDAYSLLSRSRQVSMSEFFIPLSEYQAYCELMGITDQQMKNFLVLVVTQVDAVLLVEAQKRKSKENK